MLIWRGTIYSRSVFQEETADLSATWRPDLDVYETRDEYLFILSLPGVRSEDVEVTAAGQVLVVAGTRRPPAGEGAVAHLIESGRGRFRRRLRLPANADQATVRMEIADGELVLRVAKSSGNESARTTRAPR